MGSSIFRRKYRRHKIQPRLHGVFSGHQIIRLEIIAKHGEIKTHKGGIRTRRPDNEGMCLFRWPALHITGANIARENLLPVTLATPSMRRLSLLVPWEAAAPESYPRTKQLLPHARAKW
ncbi:hypothetical protein HED50_18040 [Ochrobactrum oryzae]|nr:hypothetical protein [Brucella oryzae]